MCACIEWSVSLGDLIVGIGTLALAAVTWQLAKSSEMSLEALDLPFLLATPDRERAYDLSPVFEEGEEPVDVEWAFYVELVNLGAGPAILDGISMTEDATGNKLVKEDWEVDWLIKADDEAQLIGIPLRDEPPGRGSRMTLKVFYRSASGNRYATLHLIEMGKPPLAHRRSFKREPVGRRRKHLRRLVGRGSD